MSRSGARRRRGHGEHKGVGKDYKVEAILNDAFVDGVQFYEIKWKGYPDSHNNWVTEWDLGCPEILAEYNRTRTQNTADVGQFYKILKAAAEHHPITVRNTVDQVGYPEDFEYINESVYSDEVPRPCSPMFPCECKDRCTADCPCIRERYYDKDGRVQVEAGTALMECGPKCGCGKDCSTRVVQQGSGVKFEIRRFAHKGWGVVTRAAIARGTFIGEYVGELISFEEAEERGLADSAMGLTYLFDVDMACTGGEVADFSIDAKMQGNITHFFNHSCQPNMVTHPVYVEHRDPRLHRMAFFAACDIPAGEELAFDYSPAGSDGGGARFDCFCGAPSCRGSIFL
ncbi:hypothetical protein H4R20_003905 [Coemansia guatemalensis]|uniref:Histone-lysine N-methyltransferase n=1 Tax=Coemansia guatemalensis TaxID=2761395 RepID=A0A9W8HUC7_9FUNG|nr:hypothetical protein H4R20_003905 [Coemansia guatemalensis]